MKLVGTIDPKKVWKCSPELASATVSISNQCYTTQTAPEIAKEINERVKRIEEGLRIHGISGTFKGDENMEINGMAFKDLEKNLRKLGIDIITIRHSAGDIGCEIEGYFNPSVYKKYLDNDKPVGCEINDKPITLTKTREIKIKKDGKWLDLVPEKVKFSGPATIIFWKDGTKTVVKCQEDEYFDEEKGIAMCYLKKLFGNQGNYNNIFRQARKVTEVR